MISDKKMRFKILLVLVLIVIAIGTSYAYFTAVVTGNESGSTILVTAGELTIHYDNLSGVITANDIYPREEAWVRKTFTLTGKNNTETTMKYTIGLEVDTSTFTSGALSYSLVGENTSNNGEVVGSINNMSITKNVDYFGTGHFLTGEDLVHTYTLEIYYKDNGQNQNANQGASFTAHIIVLDEEPLMINLTANDTTEDFQTLYGNTVINMNGYELSGFITNNGNLAVYGNGNIINTGETVFENYNKAVLNDLYMTGGSADKYAVVSNSDSITEFNNVQIVSAGGGVGTTGGEVIFNSGSVYVDSASTSGRFLFGAWNGGKITINGGNFTGLTETENLGWNKAKNTRRAYVIADATSTVYITGGTFGKASTRSGYTGGINGDGTVIITGGTFGFDPSTWVAEGYEAVSDGTTWTVSKIEG